MDKPLKAQSQQSTVKNRQLTQFLFSYKRQVFFSFFLGVLSSAFFLAGPYFSKLFIDNAFIDKNLAKFITLAIQGSIIFIFSNLFNAVKDILKNRISVKLKLNLSGKFIKKLYSLDLDFLQSRPVGESAYRIADIDIMINFLLEDLPQLLLDVFRMIVIFAVCLWLNPQLTILLVVLSPLYFLHIYYIQKKLRPIYEQLWNHSAELFKEIHESFARILIIKALGLEVFKKRRYLESLIKNIRWQLKSLRWGIIGNLTTGFVSKAVFGAIMLYGGWLIIQGRLTIGSYTAAMIYLSQFGGIMESVCFKLSYISKEIVSLEKFLEIIEASPRINDSPGATSARPLKKEIRFSNVDFGYRSEKAIFKGLDLSIPAFSWVGIAGPSGCGKTTLINLILRLYDPWKGEVFWDDMELKMIKLNSLREKIAVATQQPILFDVSLRENISYGLKKITPLEVEEAGKITCIHDFVMQLASGYDSPIGEDAYRLSQGFKQRVALARAILRNPQVLILDEATSSLDSFTEDKIFHNLKIRRQGLTTIVISHRLSSVKNSDRIYFLHPDSGIETGTHQQLISSNKNYQELFNNQLAEKIF